MPWGLGFPALFGLLMEFSVGTFKTMSAEVVWSEERTGLSQSPGLARCAALLVLTRGGLAQGGKSLGIC